MGMFDHVHCAYPLPKGFEHLQDYKFQTKSFADPYLERYEIRADGTLWHIRTDTPRNMEYHGDVEFCAYTDGDAENETHKIWYDFTARFTEGRLIWLKCAKKVTEHLNDGQ